MNCANSGHLLEHTSSSTLIHGHFCMEMGVEMKLPMDWNFSADAFLALSQDVVSFQYSWEAGGRGRKTLSHVQCLEQVSRTMNMFIMSWFNVLHGHGNVMDSCCGSVFPPGKQRLLLLFSLLLLHYEPHETS